METNPFEDILIKASAEIAKLPTPLREEDVLFILRGALNPFPLKPQDKFSSLFNAKDMLGQK